MVETTTAPAVPAPEPEAAAPPAPRRARPPRPVLPEEPLVMVETHKE